MNFDGFDKWLTTVTLKVIRYKSVGTNSSLAYETEVNIKFVIWAPDEETALEHARYHYRDAIKVVCEKF